MSPNREDFEFCSKWAVSVDEMARHMMQLQPTIIHFSGHGACSEGLCDRSSSGSRDAGLVACGNGGICLKNERGGPQVIPARALRMMIRSAGTLTRVVVLNACYSDAHASELCSEVECVVGMAGAIQDHDARSFSVGFYRALGNRRSVGDAHDHAIATLAAKQLADEHIPRLRTREGVDARQVVLTSAA